MVKCPGCYPCSQSRSRKKSTGGSLQLYADGQVPVWLRYPHITNGYRNNLSYQQCLNSVFQIHNETGNIWTHLLPAVLFLPLALYDFTVTVPGLHGNLKDYFAMATFHISTQLGFLGSAYFHTFNAQGCRQIHDQCLGMDLWGVAMTPSGMSLIYAAYAFYCSWTMVLVALRPITSLFVGIVVYFTRIPERWWPGRFNIWGNSHQWWHLFIVILQLLCRIALIGFMQMRLQALC